MGVQPSPGQIGFGLPARGNQLVDAFREIRDIRGDMRDMWASLNAAAPTFQMPYQYTNNLTFPNDNTYHLYSTSAVFTAPANCTRLTYFVSCSAGTTWSTGGASGGFNVQVAAATNGAWASAAGAANGWITNYGSEESSFAGTTLLPAGTTVQFGVYVAASQTSNSGGGWAQVTGVMIWTKN